MKLSETSQRTIYAFMSDDTYRIISNLLIILSSTIYTVSVGIDGIRHFHYEASGMNHTILILDQHF